MNLARFGMMLVAVVLSCPFAGPTTLAADKARIRVDAVHDWLNALREPDQQPRELPTAWSTAYRCLRKIGPDDRALLPELIIALGDSHPRIRAIAAEVIGNMGPEARA